MKKQSTHPVQAHFLRGALYLFLLLADCALPFALADRSSAGGAAQGTMLSGVHSKAPGGCIVVNGDFETGSLPPWLNTGDTSFTSVNNSNPHSGTFSLQSGPAFTDGFIDQLVPTVAGQGYDVSFWLENDDDSGNNRFGVSFGDVTLAPEAIQRAFGYTLFTFTNVVPGANADLHFILFNQPTYFYLDDVCVTATSGGGTPTPTVTPTPTATGTPGGCIVVNGDFETGSLPPWLNTGDTSFTSVNNNNPHSGTFSLESGPAFTDGFIDQFLPTVAGQGYDVSFWLENDDDSGSNRFGASFGGVTLVPEATQSLYGYTLFTFTNVVPGANADLQFIFFNEPTYFYLDDVCVTATSGGGTPTPTPTPTATFSPTPSATATPTSTPTATATATATSTVSPTPTATARPSPTPRFAPTPRPRPTPPPRP
jgi:hypothetical protein